MRNPYLRGIYDANGELIDGTTNNNGGERYNSRVYFTPDEGATYYVSAGGYSNRTGTYTLRVSKNPADDYAADATTTGTVVVGGLGHGQCRILRRPGLVRGDPGGGQALSVRPQGTWSGGGTLYDPYLRGIYDEDSDRIDGTTNDDGGRVRNSRVYFTPDEGATYYVSAGADPRLCRHLLCRHLHAVGGRGRWHVTLSSEAAPHGMRFRAMPTPQRQRGDDQGVFGRRDLEGRDGVHPRQHPAGHWQGGEFIMPDDYSANVQTTGAVAVGGSATGVIETAHDHDWFAVDLVAGRTYNISLRGRPTYDGTLTNPYLDGVHDANGNFTANTSDDDGGEGLNSRVAFTPTADGTYYVAAGAYGDEVGT